MMKYGFRAQHVAKSLGYVNTRQVILKNVWPEDTKTCRLQERLQVRRVKFINEAGIYSLIFGSKLESTKKFRKWGFQEVLPSIRKTICVVKYNDEIWF